MRIVHLPLNTGGNPHQLSAAEHALGPSSECWVFEDNFSRLAPEDLIFHPKSGILNRELKKWRLFFRALRTKDVFHYNFGQKFFPLFVRPFKKNETLSERCKRLLWWIYAALFGRLDLWLPRLMGKKIYMTWQGDDCRQGDYCREHYTIHFVNEVPDGYYDKYSDERKRRAIRLYEHYCDGIFAINPDLMNVLPKGTHFLPYSHVDLEKWKPVSTKNSRPQIVHAPSHRDVKGTRFLVEAIDRLKKRGYDFDFVLVEGLPNSDAKRIYEQADILVDQLLAGWYGGVALELMALGKPVVCYIRHEDARHIPESMLNELPLIEANPETIESVLADLLDHRDRWPDIGQRSRAFVEKWHDPARVASDVIKVYHDKRS